MSDIKERLPIKKVLSLIRRALKLSYEARSKVSIFVSILGFLIAFVPMLLSKTLRHFTDGIYRLSVEGVGELNQTLFLLGILAILYIVQACYNAVEGYYNRADSILIHKYLREQIMRTACKVEYKYIDSYDNFRQRIEAIKTHTGELVAQSMQQIIGCLQKVITFVSLLILILNVDAGIVLALIVATIPAIVLAYFQKDEEYRERTKQIKEGAFMMHYYNENVQPEPMNEVRFLGLTEYIKQKWRDMGNKFIVEKNKMTRKHVLYNCASDLLRNSVFIIVLLIVAKKIFNNPSLGLGLFMLVMTSAQQFQKVTSELFIAAAQIVANIRYIEDYFSIEELEADALDENAQPIVKPDIVFSGVSFAYPNTKEQVLKDINVTIPYGQKVAIVGENGSGKSTFVNLLCGMYKSYMGDIFLNKVSVKDNVPAVRETLSVAFQDFGKYEDTIRYNISVSDRKKNASDEELMELIKKTGAYDTVMKRPNKLDEILGTFSETLSDLSGGEWQKIALTRAMYRNEAQIIVLDEPTAALDPMSEAELYRNFISITGNRSTLLISHRLGFSSFIDRILVFHEGRIVEDGTHEELIRKNGYYAKMFEVQAQWYN